MPYQQKRGALKRKEKRFKEDRERSGQQTLFSAGFFKDTRSTTSAASVNENTGSSSSSCETVSDRDQSDVESVQECEQEQIETGCEGFGSYGD